MKKQTAKLKSIEEELIDCRAAFVAHPKAKFGWCIHHEVLFEPIDKVSGVEGRITCIMKDKLEGERAIRLRNFRPVRVEIPRELTEACAAYNKAGAAYDEACAAYNKAGAAEDKARAAYNKATAAYDEATAAYDEARAAFDEATAAYDEARAAYNKACAAYNKAWAAYDEARAACEPELKKLHDQDWPDNTWNGKSIFTHGKNK